MGNQGLIEASPTVWRRWLASELQRLRAEAGMEQKTVAQALRCTVTKVSYFENAQRAVMPRDLDEVLLPLYGVPEERWPDYLDAAAKARRKGWWEEYDETVLPASFRRYVGFEQGTSELRAFEPQFVPGLLQTPGYTEAILRRGPVPLGDRDLARVVELRARRQQLLTRDADPARFWAILDEAALRRAASTGATAGQFEHLIAMAERPNITLQVLPFDRGIHPGMCSGFTILRFPWPTDPGLVYLESGWSAGVYLEDPHEIADHTTIFEGLAGQALDPHDTIVMLRELARDPGA